MKRRKVRVGTKKKIIAGMLLVLLAAVSVVAFNDEMVLKYYSIPTDKVEQDIRIALITDLHSCYYGKDQKLLIDAVRQEQPDIILLGGDIADDKIPHDNTKTVIEALGPEYPCFYVSGNHEYWSGEIEEIKQLFRGAGIQVLEGEGSLLAFGEISIAIYGVDDPDGGKSAFSDQLNRAGSDVDQTIFNVLLSHRPEYIETYRNYPFDLVLSGHAHGGQWRIPGILNGLLAPDQGLFPKYAGGIYPSEHQIMIVSRGLAKESTRVPRIFNHRELVIIDITAETTKEP